MFRFGRKRKTKAQIPLSEKMAAAGLNPKNEFLTMGLADVALAVFAGLSYFLLKQTAIAFFLLGILIAFDYYTLTKFKRKKATEDTLLETEFVRLFTYFGIYVDDGLPVYSALSEIMKFASPPMESRLKELLAGIDKDKTVTPFIRFASEFPSLSIREVLISVYKMVDEGTNGAYLRQFSTLFASLAAEKRKIENGRVLDRLGSVSFLPLAASGLTSALITIGIVTIIGGITSNGL